MGFNVKYIESPPEVYKTIRARNEGGTKKYKMVSTRNRPIEYPNNPIIQSITKRFMTQRNLEPIYSASYGVDWDKFVGRDMTADLALEIEQEVTDAISLCDFVDNVNVSVGALDGSSVVVNCEVSINGKFTVSRKNEIAYLSTQLNIGG